MANYMNVNQQGYYGQPPPHYSPPQYQTHKGSSGTKCCLRCICCFCCCLLLLILVFVGIIVFFFLNYKPEKPTYEIKDVTVKTFNLQGNTLDTDIGVSVEANNPNKKLKLYYDSGSSIDVSHSGSKICSGSVPEFEQPTKNITMLNIGLKGKNEMNQGFKDSLLQNQEKGRIPLEIEIKVGVRFVLQHTKTEKMDANMKCTVDVDSLKPDQKVKILDKKCDFKLKY